MNLFPWTVFLPEGFENGIIQRLYGVGQHFTFCRFSRKRKFFGNFDWDFRKCLAKGFFSDWIWRISKFPFWRQILDILQTAALKMSVNFEWILQGKHWDFVDILCDLVVYRHCILQGRYRDFFALTSYLVIAPTNGHPNSAKNLWFCRLCFRYCL